MKFSEMKYVRPDMEQMGTEIKELTHRLTDACDYECALTVFKEAQELFDRLETAAALAYVRHTIDTRDEFYDSENTFFDEELPKLQPLVQEFSLALYHSEFRGDFEVEAVSPPVGQRNLFGNFYRAGSEIIIPAGGNGYGSAYGGCRKNQSTFHHVNVFNCYRHRPGAYISCPGRGACCRSLNIIKVCVKSAVFLKILYLQLPPTARVPEPGRG